MTTNLTKKMLAAYEQYAEPQMFLSGMFKSPAQNYHNSESVEIDIQRNDEDVAIAITDLTTGPRMNSLDVYTNKEFIPPIFDEAFTLNSAQLISRMAGDTPYQDPRFQAVAMDHFAKGMRKAENKIRRAIELQASQVLQTGVATLIDSAGTTLYTVDYKAKVTHLVTAGTAWDAVGGDPVGDLGSLAEVVRNDGQKDPDMIIMGIDAWNVAIQNSAFLALFDTRRADLGRITPMTTTGEGGHFRGVVEIGNYSMELWTYGGRYKHPQTGVITQYLTPANVVMRASSGRLDTTFGAIPIFLPPERRVLPFVPPRVSRPGGGMDMTTNTWVSADGKNLFGSVGTRPLMIPTAIDTFGRIATGV